MRSCRYHIYVCIGVIRELLDCMCVFIYKEICYKQLAPVIWEAAKPQDV